MPRRRFGRWSASLRVLGDASGELIRAELAALGEEFSRNGRRLGGVALLLAAALFVLFWAVGLGLYLAVEVAHQWLPRWGAAAAVLAVALLVAAILAAVGRSRWKRLEPPTETVRRRWSGHRDWWLEQFPAGHPAERRAKGSAHGGSSPPVDES